MKKTKVLGLVFGGDVGSSHTVRVLEIAKALRETGNYDILFSGAGPYMKKVEDAGFKYINTKGLDAKEVLKIMGKFIPRFYSRKNIKELFSIEDTLLREQKPDIIIRDNFRELAGVAAKQVGITENGIYDIHVGQANVCPYYHFDFRPPNIPKIVQQIRESLPIKRGVLENFIRKSVGKELYKKSKELNLRVEKSPYEGTEADLVLLCDSEAIFPLAEKPDKYKYLGPLLVLNQSPQPKWIDLFINDKRKKVVVTSGSSGKHEKTNLFVKAFQDGEFAVAFYTHDISKKIPEEFYGCCPFEVNSVLPYADVFIMHGGLGSTYISLKNGVPMLGIYTHWEQSVNCFTVENLGAGLSIDPKKRKVSNIKDKTHQLIYNPKYKENAMNLREKLETENPLEKAVKYISGGYEEFRDGRKK